MRAPACVRCDHVTFWHHVTYVICAQQGACMGRPNVFRGYITAYFISDRISSTRSHIGREPICDQALNMRSDTKYAVIHSLYRISLHAIQRLSRTVRHWAQLWKVSWSDCMIHMLKICLYQTCKKHFFSLILHIICDVCLYNTTRLKIRSF